MHSKELIEKVKEKYEEVKCLQETAEIFKLPLSSVEYMVKNDYDRSKKKRGPKSVLTSRENFRIKREVKRLKGGQERVTAKKVKENLELIFHEKTIQRRLKKLNLKYKNNAKKIILKKEHKERRVELAQHWITSGHDWSTTVFTDEKKFNLDGPDSWMSWMEDDEEPT